jgi:hypothetical protein
MNDSIFPDNFIKAMNGLAASLQNIQKQKPVNALLMDNVIYNNDDDSESAIVTFGDGCLEVTSRDSGFCLILDTDEILSVIAFALDNGLQLPQNEDEKE